MMKAGALRSNHLPQLTNIGAWRGVDKEIGPQFSTAVTDQHGGYYTKKMILK